jgi:N-acetylglucosaminyldiphosphoundecaprenol N-acetyl-beta-D-mannosaminyltransferase
MIRHMEPDVQLRSVDVLGVRVDDVTEDEALGLLERFVASGRPHRVVTPNPEIVMAARRDPSYRAALHAAELSIPDGIGLLFAARVAGTPLRAHVRGTDLVLRLAQRSAQLGWRWFLLGAAPGVAEDAGQRLASEYPGLEIAGTRPGSPDAAADEDARRAIRAAGTVHVLLVAYGAPRQELWLARNAGAVGVPIQIGVGGVFNFLADRSPRAPRWVRRLELEWAYRLATEPWRWRRQLVLPAFAALAVIKGFQRRASRSHEQRRSRRPG